eukprot:12379134-Prorocentrum_lima.AAC.1
MTSSLVGSEMCIRDSCRAPCDSPEQCTPERAASTRSRQEWSSTSNASVSYTHLTLPTICSV